MKCKQTREVIDTASRHTLYSDSVTTHLSGCPDCRRHSDGTASLLMLLNAQPRVESPADFDIKVSMGIARAQADLLSDKTTSLLALLKTQPRVEAPADFDFRLSAGIARAQAERLNQTSVFERAWEKLARTLSFGQATAMAAAALVVVTASTIYINLDYSVPTRSGDVAISGPDKSTPNEVKSAPVNTAPVVNPGRMIAATSPGRVVKIRPAMIRSDELQAINNSPEDMSSREKVFDPKTRRYVNLDRSFGADLAKSGADTPSPTL